MSITQQFVVRSRGASARKLTIERAQKKCPVRCRVFLNRKSDLEYMSAARNPVRAEPFAKPAGTGEDVYHGNCRCHVVTVRKVFGQIISPSRTQCRNNASRYFSHNKRAIATFQGKFILKGCKESKAPATNQVYKASRASALEKRLKGARGRPG